MPAGENGLTDCRGLLQRLQDARARTDSIFSLLAPGALYDRAIPERHRLIFYLGHLEAFDWNLLGRTGWELPSFRPSFDQLFAFGIDPVSGNLPDDRAADWPAEKEIRAYNAQAREILDRRAAAAEEATDSGSSSTDRTMMEAAIEHRLMHAETLAYLLHELPYERKRAQPRNGMPETPSPIAQMVSIPDGMATLGQPRNGDFGWDNEFEEHAVRVPGFRLDAYPVTNGEFLEFVRAGGYGDQSLWETADWEWKERAGVEHPHFWARSGAEWRFRGMFEAQPLQLKDPVFVSYAEAAAYAKWARKSLPTEAQWHRAAYATASSSEKPFPWGNDEPGEDHGNFNFHHWDPTPVNAHPAGGSELGIFDLLGNGWEWTSTIFQPFPGFQPFWFYKGYSADFFDGKHRVMKGGSPRTASVMLRRSFRNWFQPHYPYVYAKFRCVED
jgi:iron(II)-dependent oxidoreductase